MSSGLLYLVLSSTEHPLPDRDAMRSFLSVLAPESAAWFLHLRLLLLESNAVGFFFGFGFEAQSHIA